MLFLNDVPFYHKFLLSFSLVPRLQKRMQQSHEQHKSDLASLQHSGYADKQKVEQQQQIIAQLSEENQRYRMSVANTDEVTSMQNQIRALTAEKQHTAQRVADSDNNIASLKHELTKYVYIPVAVSFINGPVKGNGCRRRVHLISISICATTLLRIFSKSADLSKKGILLNFWPIN